MGQGQSWHPRQHGTLNGKGERGGWQPSITQALAAVLETEPGLLSPVTVLQPLDSVASTQQE